MKRKSYYDVLTELVMIRFEDYEAKGSIVEGDTLVVNMTLEKDDDVETFANTLIESGFSVVILPDGDEFKAKVYKKY